MLFKIFKRVSQVRGFATKQKLVRKTPLQKSAPLITCKVPKFNLSVEQASEETSGYHNLKFGDIPLASYGWKHHKSKNDFFTIHPVAVAKEFIMEEQAFEKLGLHKQLIQNIRGNFEIIRPAFIQYEAFTQIRNMDHVLIAAETGCGKTLAYLLPIVQQILEQKTRTSEHRKMNTPLAIVLTPGRELAEQIYSVALKLCMELDIGIKVLTGGNTKQQIVNPTFEDVDLVIGSIGATSKLVTTSIYRMNHVRHVVIDEADTMLDDSFNNKLVYFLRKFPFHKNHLHDCGDIGTQLIMVGATMPTNSSEILRPIIDPSTINEVCSPNLHRILPHVRQHFLRMRKISRPMQLLTLAKDAVDKKRPILIFGNKSSTSDYVSIFLNEHGIECYNLNGDMLNKIRVGRFDSFQRGEINVLSTTDVASRGLDTTRVRHVINFDFPLHVADYIHRIGRIGRIGSPDNCEVTNFISSIREVDLVQRIEHTARTKGVLPNVNANITNIIQTRILADCEKDEYALFR